MSAKDLTNEEVAAVLDTLMITGIAPTPYEKECLIEAAERLRRENEDDKT